MMTQLEQLVRNLENRDAGWVVRRDAAELLGRLAQGAIIALESQKNDADMDVQLQVERSMEAIYALALPGPVKRAEHTLRDLAMSCEKGAARVVEPNENGFAVTVRLDSDRSQRVYIMPHETRDGRRLVRVYTFCGEPSPDMYAWVLRANSKIAHGAFSLFPTKTGERMVLLNNIPRSEATPAMVKVAVKEIAYYGDKLERQLGKDDEF